MDVLMDTALRHILAVYFIHDFNQIPTNHTIAWINYLSSWFLYQSDSSLE
jgi:hypothetical protein